MLLALAAILAGVVSLALLFVSRTPGEDSPEAGFARDMAVHHAQAVQMAGTVRDRTQDPAIRVLANDIILSQQDEIGQMQGWLAAWGLSANSSEPQMAWMGDPMTGRMPGMASPEDLARLQQASPQEVDEQFLQLMIPHHQAAIPMAEAVLERSDRPEVRRLAQKVIASQQEEIRGMQALLQSKGLPPAEDSGPSPMNVPQPSHDFTETLWNTLRLAALPLAVLAVAWLVLDALRRRAGLAKSVKSPLWRALAIGGLATGAILLFGLAPERFGEATAQGVLSCGAGVIAAVTAAIILAWPSRPAYSCGAASALALIVLWAVFQFAPGLGMEEADLIGIFTGATGLVAVTACAVLWSRARRVRRPAWRHLEKR